MKSSAAPGKAIPSSGGWMPQRAVSEFFGVSVMSLWRWERDPKMAFPKSVEINGRRYFPRDQIVAYQPPAKAPQVKRVQPSRKSAAASQNA